MEVEVMASQEATSSAAAAAAARQTSAAKDFRKRSKAGEQSAPDSSGAPGKRPKIESIPDDFLEFLPPAEDEERSNDAGTSVMKGKACRQFWKAGEYEGSPQKNNSVGMDHVRVHPKFLHSNATSHKWALGAAAELLDNGLDEYVNGATHIKIDVIKSPIDDSPMLLFEDNGGGMTQNRLRECMSFGYSEKSKNANTIGQYGNGFKTSTMRLGSDVIVFSKSVAKDGKLPTASVGFLSYTFLVETGQQDIMVPMLDFEDEGGTLKRILRGTEEDWDRNAKTITEWSPYRSEEMLRNQFKKIKGHGTRIMIYNLWFDEQKQLELDFETDPHDIQLRDNRETNMASAVAYPSARHFFLYKHSLRVYASILYLRIPRGFNIWLRGKLVEHHNIVSDLMHIQELTYRPQGGPDGLPGNNLMAVVTIGFVKHATEHIDVQGFNVYHNNRLIKPFWRLWNSASSQGRGVIGVLEANFVAPAHDKQGFEKTTVLQRLEARLQGMQKDYWNKNCRLVGYQGTPGGRKKSSAREDESLWRPSGRLGRTLRSATKKSAKESSPQFTADDSDEEDIDAEDDEQDGKEDKQEEEEAVEGRVLRRRRSPVRRDVERDDDEQTPRKSPRSATKPKATPARKPLPRTEVEAETIELGEADVPAKQADTPKPASGKPSKSFGKSSRPPAAANNPPPLPTQPKHQLGKALLVDGEPPNLERMQEILSSNDALSSRLDKLEESDAAKLQLEILRRERAEEQLETSQKRAQDLEDEITRMEEELQSVQVGLLKERDNLKATLEEERQQREADDVEIRRQLKTALQRVRELEAEVKTLKNGGNNKV